MTVSSPGTGGTIGGPPTLTQREIETTAQTYFGKQLMGIFSDTLEIPFSQIGLTNVWKYSSAATNPTIPPLIRTRVALGGDQSADEGWRDQISSLVDLLPPDVKAMLLSQVGLDPESRVPEYVALDQVLGNTSTVLAWLEGIKAPTESATAIELNTLYQNLPQAVSNELFAVGSDISNGANGYLAFVGRNNPNYDDLAYVSREVSNSLEAFNDSTED